MRYLGIEVDDALEMAEQTEIRSALVAWQTTLVCWVSRKPTLANTGFRCISVS